jgi:type IX secretion system PorP/SprF family membrane protein
MRIQLLIAFIIGMGITAKAQLNPLGATFYQNQYLGNPAMAGLNEGFRLNAGFNQQWSQIPGSPKAQFITVDHRSNKVGLGLSLYADKAGLLKRTRAVATYAYHLPLSADNDQLHFGISLGVLSERLSSEDVDGTPLDISVQRFNERPVTLDGDFGMAYTSGRLNIQVAIPNLKNFFTTERYNTLNWNTFFTAISYKFITDSTKRAFIIEPKVSYRGVKGYDDMFDVGVNVAMNSNKIYGTIIYHTTNSISVGMGVNFNKFSIFGMHTSGTSALRNYSSGNFEIGLGVLF